MGNSKNDEQFYHHFTFLVKELYRVLKDGCLVSFHCQNIPAQIGKDGYYGRKDFRGELIRLFESVGFVYYSEVIIWKDPVIQMQRTKALGLLHKQIKKDSSRCHQGYPDYLVTVKKPGKREEVPGMFEEYYGLDEIPNSSKEQRSIKIWRRYASPVWFDINPSDTLQFRTAKEQDDERHICPLQLQVIKRSLQLYTNPNDIVLDPFNGIGSSGYCAIEMGRKYIGIELKDSYYELSQRNLEYIENKPVQLSLLD
jgi:DNA modification methylase